MIVANEVIILSVLLHISAIIENQFSRDQCEFQMGYLAVPILVAIYNACDRDVGQFKLHSDSRVFILPTLKELP